MIISVKTGGLFEYCTLDGTCNTVTYFDFIFLELYPILDDDSVLIMDNASIHRNNIFRIVICFLGIELI